MIVHSFGRYSTATQFIETFPLNTNTFKALEIKNESTETETKESNSSAHDEAQGGITPQNQQADASEAE